jgi:hypothetical protein
MHLKPPHGSYLEAAPGASMDSNSTPRTAMSENSRRSSASSAAALRGEGESQRPGKRKRRADPLEAPVDSSYSLRRRRSRIMPDQVNGGDPFEMPPSNSVRESSQGQDPDMEYFTGELQSRMQDAMEADRPTENEEADAQASMEPKKRGRRAFRFRAAVTPPESAMATPAPGTPFNGHDMGGGMGTDQEPARLVRRLPGRRRAPNPNTSIEADLRRQLNLKTTFRAVVKALKPVLLELSSRSVEHLEDDEDAYKHCPEYDEIVSQLDAYLERRLAEVDAKNRLELRRIDGDLKSGQDYVQREYQVSVFRVLTSTNNYSIV